MDALLLGLSLGLGAGLAPGPLLALVVQATLERGFAAGARVAAAPLVTDAPIIVLCVLVLDGLGDDVLAALSLAGAAFVAWLAVDALRTRPSESQPASGDLRRAALVNVLSPHPWLFWLTVGGPLVVGDAGALFVAGFYVTLVGAKVAVAALVAAGRRRSVTARAVPGAVAARVAGNRVLARFGAARIVSAALLGAAAVALLVDALARLAG